MPGTQKRTFSLPDEHAAFIDDSVAAGKYASASEVIRAGLRALQERDAAIEKWLKDEVSATYDAVMSGQQPTHDVGDVFDRLRDLHEKSLRS